MESSKKMPLVASVTDVDTANRTIMLSACVAVYDDNPEQDESLINPNILLGNIYERPKKWGVRQSLIDAFGDIIIDLGEGKLPFINH